MTRPTAVSLSALAATLMACAALTLVTPRPASANLLNPVCGAIGLVSGIAGKVCKVAGNGGRVLQAGKKLLGGHVGGALKALAGSAPAAVGSKVVFAAGLAAFGGWIAGGAHAALQLVAGVIERTSRPQLRSTWFSATYWRMAAISALLTLPFLFAAAIQALLRSDLSLLFRAALGYLPLALLGVSLAAPLTMLLLSATDAMSGAVAAASSNASSRFLAKLTTAGTVLSIGSRSPFLDCFLAVLVVAVAVVLWLEMLVRDAAIYVVVLMLPLIFATLVWPARRVWAVRTAELLFALILSKFAIVSVLSLGGAALGSAGWFGYGEMTLGLVLVGLAATSPWVLMRLLPVTELASSLHGMRSPTELSAAHDRALQSGLASHGRADDLPALMRGGGSSGGEPANELTKLEPVPAVEPSGVAPSAEPSGAAPEAGPLPDRQPGTMDGEAPPDRTGTTGGGAIPAEPTAPVVDLGVELREKEPLSLGPEAFDSPPPAESAAPLAAEPAPSAPAAQEPPRTWPVERAADLFDQANPLPPRQVPEDGRQ